MSGILCVINFDGEPVREELLRRMCEPVLYRGPHGITHFIDKNAGFSYLSLVSTPEAEFERQPYRDPQSGLTFLWDGRVDNRTELIAELFETSHELDPITDLEIVIRGFSKWGEELPEKIIGDFALVVWNPVTKTIFAARDIVAGRKIHYARMGNTVCIASEAQQILKHPKMSLKLREDVLFAWMSGGPGRAECIYDNIEALPNACTLRLTKDQAVVWNYWDINPDLKIRYKRTEEYASHLRDVLTEAVRCRLRTRSKSIGFCLSGGLDSTTVTALAETFCRSINLRQEAISYQFKSFPNCDETTLIESFLRIHPEISHTYIDAEREGVMEYPMNPHSFEGPWVRNWPHMATVFSRLKTKGVEVMLTGEGGDEVVGGTLMAFQHRFWRGDLTALIDVIRVSRDYNLPLFKHLHQTLLRPVIPDSVVHLVKRLLGRPINSRPPLPTWIEAAEIGETGITIAPSRWKNFENLDLARRFKHTTIFSSMIHSTFADYEYNGGSYGIESRHPFFDRRVMEFSLAVPVKLWAQKYYTRWLLRVAGAGILPDDVRWKRKKVILNEVIGNSTEKNRAYVNSLLEYSSRHTAKVTDIAKFRQAFDDFFNSHKQLTQWNLLCAFIIQCWLYTHRRRLEQDSVEVLHQSVANLG